MPPLPLAGFARGARCAGRMRCSITSGATNEAALMRKTGPVPTQAMRTPARPGR